MRTLGIDLAARSTTTAACMIRWSTSGAEVERLELGCDDDELLTLIEAVDRAGIDAPLGWPEAFVDAISAYGQGRQAAFATGEAWSLDLRMRRTDRHVRDLTGRWPLSVSTERLGVTALRCLRLLGLLAEGGEPVDRAGSGKVIEVYPAAALSMWGVFEPEDTQLKPLRRYKGSSEESAERRRALARRLSERAPGLALEEVGTDHELDAIVASLVARARALDLTIMPSGDAQTRAARAEGWIHLPVVSSLVELVHPA